MPTDLYFYFISIYILFMKEELIFLILKIFKGLTQAQKGSIVMMINSEMFNLVDYGMARLGNDAENARNVIDKMLENIEWEYQEYSIDYEIKGGSTAYQLIGHMIGQSFSIMEDCNTMKAYAGGNLNWEVSCLIREAICSVTSEEQWAGYITSIKNMLEECVEKMEFDAKANHYYTRIMISFAELHSIFDMLLDYETDPRWRGDLPSDDRIR